MTLAQALSKARTEEVVKDAYVRALGLKNVSKGQVDIETEAIWFEAKLDPKPVAAMFAQLLFYVRQAHLVGKPIPAFLGVVDRDKAALLETERARPVLVDETIAWPAAASAVGKACIAQVAAHIEGHFTTYSITADEREFIATVKAAIQEGRIIRTPITPDNLRQVFNKWVEMIGQEISVPSDGDFAELFFADIMHDGDNAAMTNLSARLLYDGGKPVFVLKGKTYDLASQRGYRNFWRIYHRPPETKHRHYLLERRDMLLPIDEQKFKGAYYTPPHIVDKAYDLLTATLGKGWQEKYIIWDMCCGVGNLELSHSNPRNLFMSTLDQPDIDNIRARGLFPGAEIFQYDYLNDDVTDFGEIDYSLSKKVPMALRRAIADVKAGVEGAKPILVLINPPYAEVTSGGNTAADVVGNSKPGVTKTLFGKAGMADYGKAANELFMQFVARIDRELPTAILAMFSKLKYVSTPTLDRFRDIWSARYLGGFVFHSRLFDGLKGNYPIGFLIWDTAENDSVGDVTTNVLDDAGNIIGRQTFLNYDEKPLLTDWVARPRANTHAVVPLKNAIDPATATKDLRGTRWSNDAVAWLNCGGNDFQHAVRDTFVFSSGFSSARGFFVNADNLWQAAIVFSVRRLIKPTWLNDRDQFLQPSQPLTGEFKFDCLIWMLFNGSNLTAGADGLRWNDCDWSLINHFIPFTEREVGAQGRFESNFMVRHMQGKTFSPEARAVLDEGRNLWTRFHAMQFPHKIRQEYKLGRPDAGWYQIRRALEAYGDIELTDFDPFKATYAALGDKLRPQVFSLGFLPE